MHEKTEGSHAWNSKEGACLTIITQRPASATVNTLIVNTQSTLQPRLAKSLAGTPQPYSNTRTVEALFHLRAEVWGSKRPIPKLVLRVDKI